MVDRPSPLLAAARTLATDATTAEVTGAWRAAGVPSLLCKGPTVAAWLYRDGRVRSYGDSDLFVPPHALARAQAVLTQLGFDARPYDEPQLSVHATPWVRRRDGAQVDLHHALWGASVPPAHQWDVLRAGYTETMPIGGAEVDVPTLPARALFVATHAAQHARKEEKPLEDLRRALAEAGDAVWAQAAELGDHLGATAALAFGLAQRPEGLDLARRLPYTRAWLGAQRGTRTVTVGFERIAQAHGTRARAAMLARAVFPPPDVLRWWSPIARRGGAGLTAAYALRLVRLGARGIPALVAWRRSRSSQDA